jgi:hypothetical protein
MSSLVHAQRQFLKHVFWVTKGNLVAAKFKNENSKHYYTDPWREIQ